jgi:hypothetical protein
VKVPPTAARQVSAWGFEKVDQINIIKKRGSFYCLFVNPLLKSVSSQGSV